MKRLPLLALFIITALATLLVACNTGQSIPLFPEPTVNDVTFDGDTIIITGNHFFQVESGNVFPTNLTISVCGEVVGNLVMTGSLKTVTFPPGKIATIATATKIVGQLTGQITSEHTGVRITNPDGQTTNINVQCNAEEVEENGNETAEDDNDDVEESDDDDTSQDDNEEIVDDEEDEDVEDNNADEDNSENPEEQDNEDAEDPDGEEEVDDENGQDSEDTSDEETLDDKDDEILENEDAESPEDTNEDTESNDEEETPEEQDEEAIEDEENEDNNSETPEEQDNEDAEDTSDEESEGEDDGNIEDEEDQDVEEDDPDEVISVRIDPEDFLLEFGEELQFSATVEVSGPLSTDVTWESSDDTVISINATGLAIATGAGSAQVTAISAANPAELATATIVVSEPFTLLIDMGLVATDEYRLLFTGEGELFVDWGDGTTETITDPVLPTHTYTDDSEYRIRVTGSLEDGQYGSHGGWYSQPAAVALESWGNLGLTNLNGAFALAEHLEWVPEQLPAGITDLGGMFARNSNEFDSFSIAGWDTSSVQNMSSMFSDAESFNQDISAWDTSQVSTMMTMFKNAHTFNQDIGGWDTGRVTDMHGMFQNALAFNQDIGNWDVSRVTTMNAMFANATSFNQDIGGWNTESLKTLSSTFSGAIAFNQDLNWDTPALIDTGWTFQDAVSFNGNVSNWNMSKVTHSRGMFDGAAQFNQDISGWDMSQVTFMRGMFTYAERFNQDISGWNVGKVTNMWNMFQGATAFNQDLSGWCVRLIEEEPVRFSSGSALTRAHMPDWGAECGFALVFDTDKAGTMLFDLNLRGNGIITIDWGDGTVPEVVTNPHNPQHEFAHACECVVRVDGMLTGAEFGGNSDSSGQGVNGITAVRHWGDFEYVSLANAFNSAENLVEVPDWLPNGVSNLSSMFRSATSFNQDISNWDTSSVTRMSWMFASTPFNQDISSWNVRSVRNMDAMFSSAKSFNQPIGSWDTDSLQSIDRMFSGALAFNRSLSGWSTTSIRDMRYAFYNAINFNGDISDWDTSQVTNMDGMFHSAARFDQDLSGWCVEQIDSLPGGFYQNSTWLAGNEAYHPKWGEPCSD